LIVLLSCGLVDVVTAVLVLFLCFVLAHIRREEKTTKLSYSCEDVGESVLHEDCDFFQEVRGDERVKRPGASLASLFVHCSMHLSMFALLPWWEEGVVLGAQGEEGWGRELGGIDGVRGSRGLFIMLWTVAPACN
jgi:hypothetical protein